MTRDDIEYAIENTQVILAPERQIATFGNTSFEFHLISELMDRVDQVRIRTGRIEAERPKILSPNRYCRMMLEGFGEKAQETWNGCASTRSRSRYCVTGFNFANLASRKKL